MTRNHERAAEDLRDQGYAVFPDLLSPDEASRLRSIVLDLVMALEPPRFHSVDTVPLDARSGISSSGVFIHELFRRHPQTRPLMLRAPVVSALHAYLRQPVLEEVGAMVSDRERPFFPWHTHIDGIDEGVRFRANAWPEKTRPERVLTLLYLDDIDAARGPLYVMPRRSGDPTEPLGDEHDPEWPGRVELLPKAGTLVAIDQCTWHAARPLTLPGHRVVAGLYVAAGDITPPDWADAALRDEPFEVPTP